MRTPETFSLIEPLTSEIAWRTRMNARAAGDCHHTMKTVSTGITDSEISASSGSSQNR